VPFEGAWHAARVRSAVDQLADFTNPSYAEAMARYFQVKPGGYGEGDVFLGIRLSELRRLAKPYARLAYRSSDWLPLLTSAIHEHRQLALLIMAARSVRGTEAEQTQVYRDYLDHTAHVNNWDLVDVSCGPIVGRYLEARDRAPLYNLARSSLVWERRIAMVSTQHFLRAAETEDLFRISELLLFDQHDLIQKAVGWSLREAGKRVDRTALRDFLDEHAARMPRTALRYAIEHFDQAERQHYLRLRSRIDVPDGASQRRDRGDSAPSGTA
jgi:3-methyladenine DNA glycosylase AlkD